MRGRALILATLVVAAAPARAADVLTQSSPSPTSVAPATLAAWPGFEINRTQELAALAWGATPMPAPASIIAVPCAEPPVATGAADPMPARTRYLPLIRAAECRHGPRQGFALNPHTSAISGARPLVWRRFGSVKGSGAGGIDMSST